MEGQCVLEREAGFGVAAFDGFPNKRTGIERHPLCRAEYMSS